MWFEESVELQLEYYAQSDTPIDPYLTHTINTYMKMAPSLNLDEKVKDVVVHQAGLVFNLYQPGSSELRKRLDVLINFASENDKLSYLKDPLKEGLKKKVEAIASKGDELVILINQNQQAFWDRREDFLGKYAKLNEMIEVWVLTCSPSDTEVSYVKRPFLETMETIIHTLIDSNLNNITSTHPPQPTDPISWEKCFEWAAAYGIEKTIIIEAMEAYINALVNLIRKLQKHGYGTTEYEKNLEETREILEENR